MKGAKYRIRPSYTKYGDATFVLEKRVLGFFWRTMETAGSDSYLKRSLGLRLRHDNAPVLRLDSAGKPL